MTRNLAYATALGLAMTVGSTAASAQSLPTDGLVNVNLQNILNNLAVDLNIDRANIPVTAQVPVNVAANVCGVSLNVLSAQIGTGGATCTAVTGSQQLTQAVQQQMAAGGTTVGTQTGTTVGSTTTGTVTAPTTGTTGVTTSTRAHTMAPGQQQKAGDVRARDVAPGHTKTGKSAKTKAPSQQPLATTEPQQ